MSITEKKMVSMFVNWPIKFITAAIVIALFVVVGCVDRDLRTKAFSECETLVNILDKPASSTQFSSMGVSQGEIESLQSFLINCGYSHRRGKFVTDFYQRSLGPKSDRVFFIYEFLLDCDSIRLIVGFDLEKEPLVTSLKIEPLEKVNPMISDRSKSILSQNTKAE